MVEIWLRRFSATFHSFSPCCIRKRWLIAGVSKIAEPPLNDLWTIPGEEHLLAEFEAADRTSFQRTDPVAHYHALQIREFLQAIRAGRRPFVTGEDGRAVVEMFSAIYRSQQTGVPVSLPLAAA